MLLDKYTMNFDFPRPESRVLTVLLVFITRSYLKSIAEDASVENNSSGDTPVDVVPKSGNLIYSIIHQISILKMGKTKLLF